MIDYFTPISLCVLETMYVLRAVCRPSAETGVTQKDKIMSDDPVAMRWRS